MSNVIAYALLAFAACGTALADQPRVPEAWAQTLERAAPLPAYVQRQNIFAADEVPWQQLDPLTRRKVIFSRRATLVVLEIQRNGKPHDFTHWHQHDQITHVLEGEVEAIVGRDARRIDAGGFYVCDSNVPHSLRILSDRVKIVEVFTPTRDDFRSKPWVGAAGKPTLAGTALSTNEVRAAVHAWFALFDRNAPVAEFLPYLADHALDMKFPEAHLKSPSEFSRWYAGILATIRSASHDVQSVDVALAGTHAVVNLVVRWQAVKRDGQRLDFTVRQRWLVDRAPSGQPVIRSYEVRPLNSDR